MSSLIPGPWPTIEARTILLLIARRYYDKTHILDNTTNICAPNKWLITCAENDNGYGFVILRSNPNWEWPSWSSMKPKENFWLIEAQLDARSPNFFDDLDMIIEKLNKHVTT